MAGETSAAIRQSLIECLGGILSPSQEIRNAAEEQLKMLETTDEFGVYLTEFTISPESDLSGRQLASVLLKQYVEAHWCSGQDKFRPPVTPPQAKAVIRQMLPDGLADPSSKVRNSVAYALSKIASIDFPDDWPNLFDWLVRAISSGNPDLVHGAMRVLVETARELAEDQLAVVTPILIPHLYSIYLGEQKFNVRTRARAIEIFTTMVQTVEYFSLRNDYRKLLTPQLPQFVEDLAKGLAVPLGPDHDIGLQKQIFKALGAVVQVFPKMVRQLFQEIMPPLWQVLTNCAAHYVQTVVNGDSEQDDAVDSDGESVTMDTLIYAVFEFTGSLVQQESFHPLLMPHLPGFIFYSLYYMQMTNEDIETWTMEINTYVEDEDEETLSYSVRLGAKDLLMQMLDPGFDTHLTKDAPFALWKSIEKLYSQLAKPDQAEDPNRWKYFEVIAAILTIHSPDLMQHQELAQRVVPLLEIMKANFQLGNSPDFLVGRIMEFQASVCQFLADGIVTAALHHTAVAISQKERPVLQVHACKAVAQYCTTLRAVKRSNLFTPSVASLATALLSMIEGSGTYMLQLGLETLVLVLSMSPETTAACCHQITDLSVQLFVAFSQDHVLVDTVKDLIGLMAENPACIQVLHTNALPVLTRILSSEVQPMLMAATLDLLGPIVRHTPAPLPDALIRECVHIGMLIINTDDESIMHNGSECLRAFASAAGEQLATWPPNESPKALDVIVLATCQLLHPSRPENSAMFVGRLVCILSLKLRDHLTPKLNDILRSVLGKLQQVQKDINVQSLITVFARLLEFHLTDVVSFLSNTCGPDGKSALQFVLTRWCASQSHFFSAYEKTVCVFGLCHLLRYGLNSGDQRLQELTVPGDEIFSADEGIRTRSKTKSVPRQVTIIPVLVKIFKLLLNEMTYQFELNKRTAGAKMIAASNQALGRQGGAEGDVADDDDGDEGDDWVDCDDGDDGDLANGLDSLLGGLGGVMDDLDGPRDLDLQQDTVMHVDLPIFLVDFLLDIGQQPCLPALQAHLSKDEHATLEMILQSGEKVQVLKQSRATAYRPAQQ
eukprot:scpid22203/ scgid1813/ Importin-9; Importin-9a; Importin-9b; Ran-binding protein 9